MKTPKRRNRPDASEWSEQQRMRTIAANQKCIEQWTDNHVGPRDKGFVNIHLPGSMMHKAAQKAGIVKHADTFVIREVNSDGPRKLPVELYAAYEGMPQGSTFILTCGGDDDGATLSIYTPSDHAVSQMTALN